MKKLILILCVLTGALAGVVFNRYSYVFNAAKIQEQNTEERKTDTLENKNSFGIPQKISIPKLGIYTNVETVNLDSEGRMDVPKDANNTGWYGLGTRPGEIGSAVIDGHLDTKSGPAVFYMLNTLNRGDVIRLIDDNNQSIEFMVTGKISYKDDDFPIDTVFNMNDKQRLNLITCDGNYDKQKKNYSKRMVIFSELRK